MKKGIIFDMDGVLVDTEWLYYQRLVEMMKSLECYVEDDTLKSVVGMSGTHFYPFIANYANMDVDKMIDFYQAYETSHPVTYNYDKIFRRDSIDIMQYAKKQRLGLAIASSSRREMIERVTKNCDIHHFFDVIMSGEDFKESKPNPEIYLETANNLNLSPNECIAIEDSSIGIKAGKEAGMTVIALEDDRFSIDQSFADYRCSSMSEIAALIEQLA